MPKREKIVQLRVAVDFFMRKYKNRATRKTYKYCFDLFYEIVSPDRTVQSIAPVDIQRFINAQIERNNAEATIEKRHRELHHFFKWCIDMGYIKTNPTDQFKMKKPEVKIDERKVISIEEIQKLIRYLEAVNDVKVLLIVRLLAETGCRRGGIAGMKLSDFDLEKRTIYVLEKDKKLRPVYFSEDTQALARLWFEMRPVCNHEYVFTGANVPFEPMLASSIAQVIRRRCHAAGIGSYGTHTFRHRKGFEMFRSGAAPILVAEVLGHADGGLIAQKHYSDYRREIVQALSEATFLTQKKVDPQSEDKKIVEFTPFRKSK